MFPKVDLREIVVARTGECREKRMRKVDLACGGTESVESVSIGQPVRLDNLRRTEDSGPLNGPATDDESESSKQTTRDRQDGAIVIHTPDGRDVRLEAGSNFTDTNQPGIYRANVGSTETLFAVNLSATESNTAPLDLEQLEQRGVRFPVEQTRNERVDRIRQQRDTELEGHQKVWRWLIVLALTTLIVETWWAGRAEHGTAKPPMK